MNELGSEAEVPADGSCATCGRARRLGNLKPVYLEPAKADPFCSTECARRWYGVPLPAAAPRKSAAYVETLRKSG